MKETIELLAGLGFTADAIKEMIAGATNVSINIFDGNNNVVVIGGNYFESGFNGHPSRKSKRATQGSSESTEEEMGEAEPEAEQSSFNERDAQPPPEQPPPGPDPDLVQKVRDHLAQLQVELDGVNLLSFEENGLREVLVAQDKDAAEEALIENEPLPFD